MNSTDSEFQLYLKTFIIAISGFIATVFVLQLTNYAIKGVEDAVKYNRYKEAVQEYRDCAKNLKDDYRVRDYCGESPSSSMML